MQALCLTSNFPRWTGDSTTPFVLHLCQDLLRRSMDIEVLAPHAPGAARQETLDGVPVRRFRYLLPETQQTVCYGGGALINVRGSKTTAAKVPALVASELAATLRALGRGQHSLLHSHWVVPQGVVGTVAAHRTGVPHVVTVHGGDIFGLRSRGLIVAKRAALELADAVTVNSSATEAAVLDIAPGVRRLMRIPMGVVTRDADHTRVLEARWRFRRGEGPLLVFAGRLVAEKGVADVLHAVALLAGDLPDVSAVVAGEGQDRESFERLALDLGLTDRVYFPGWVEAAALPDLLSAADVVVAPSRTAPGGWVEAQGLSIAEALALARPVVATATGGIGDTVIHGRTGLLVPEHAPAALSAAVRQLHRAPDLATRLGEAGRKHVHSSLSRDSSADAFAALYASVCKEHYQSPRLSPRHRPLRFRGQRQMLNSS